MSRSKLMAAIATVCMIAVAGAVAWAKSADRDSCVDACHQAKTRCIDTCETHDNPMECDEDCQETAQDCTRQC